MEALQRIDERLADIQAQIAEIRVIYDSHSRRLDKLESEIYGNGRAGLATQLRAVLWLASGSLTFAALILAQTIAAWLH